MVDPTIIAAGVTIAADMLQKTILSGNHDIATAVVNGTSYSMKVINEIHTHHGQYTEAPVPIMGALPLTKEEEKSIHKNIILVSMKGAGAGAAEAIFGYEYEKGCKTYQLCFYIKHGHHLEAGAALWVKGSKVNGENYDGKIHKSAESLIHTIQKKQPQTSYSKDGEGTSVTVDGVKVSHTSGQSFTFLVEEV